MKKLLIIPALLFILSSCGGAKKSSETEPTASTPASEFVSDGHNARNSLSYHGVYEGTIPAASAPGIKVTINIPNDSTYTRTQVYIDHEDKTFEDSGKYTWNEAGSTITLHGEESANQYFVAEGRLIMLDTEGNKIEGELADHYVLSQTSGIE